MYVSDFDQDVLADGMWEQFFTRKARAPDPPGEKDAWLATLSGVCLGQRRLLPFGDNIERAHRSGVAYIAQPGGSIRDDNVIETCDKYGIVSGHDPRPTVPPLIRRPPPPRGLFFRGKIRCPTFSR